MRHREAPSRYSQPTDFQKSDAEYEAGLREQFRSLIQDFLLKHVPITRLMGPNKIGEVVSKIVITQESEAKQNWYGDTVRKWSIIVPRIGYFRVSENLTIHELKIQQSVYKQEFYQDIIDLIYMELSSLGHPELITEAAFHHPRIQKKFKLLIQAQVPISIEDLRAHIHQVAFEMFSPKNGQWGAPEQN